MTDFIEVTDITKDGHECRITPTNETGIHSGRRRYHVQCLTCGVEVHPATTGPVQMIESHLRDARDTPEFLRRQLLAMTIARDEACDGWAACERDRIDEVSLTAETRVELTRKSAEHGDFKRIAELRKVGRR